MSEYDPSGQQSLADPSGSGEPRSIPSQQISDHPSTMTSQSSNADALSAIHMPFDFGDVQFMPASMQQPQSASTSAAALTTDDGTARAPPKARKRKTADGAPIREGDGVSGSRGGGAGGRGSRGGRGGRGGAANGGTRKASKTQAQLQEHQEHQQQQEGAQTPGTFGTLDDSASTSRAASLAPSTPAGGTGPSTPTKRGGGRGGGGGGGGRGRGGGRGAGRGRGSRGRGRAGSRQTSVRTATASVAPGSGAGREDSTTAAPDGIDADEDGPGGGGGDEDGNVNEVGEDDSSEDENVEQGLEEDEMARQELIQRDRSTRMAPLMKAMTEEQMDRYSAFRRSYLDKRFVRRLVAHLTRQTVTPQVATLVAGVGKVFIGEIVERARHIRQQRSAGQANVADDDAAALRPEILIEALQQYRQDREVPGRYAISAPNFNAGLGGNGQRRHLF